MAGPCLCGDPYCGSCGNPGLAVLEEAEDALVSALHDANLDADEYEIVRIVGLAAVEEARKAAKRTADQINANYAEAQAMKDWQS